MTTLNLEKVDLGGLLNLVPISRLDLIQDFSNGFAEASRQTGSQDNAISRCCKGHVGYKSSGRTPDGRKRIWVYLEDYGQEQNQQLKGAN